MANNNVLKIGAQELAALAKSMKDQAKKELMIAGAREPNEEDAPYRPGPGDGKPPWPGYPKPYQPKLAHGEGRGPQQKFHDEYNQPLKNPPWQHINPRGDKIDIDWQKKEYMEQHPQFFKDLQISQSPVDALRKGTTPGLSSRQIRDIIKPHTKQDQFGHPTGSLRGA